MFTPPSTIINRCKDRLIPSATKGGMDGNVVLLFSRVKHKGELEFQLEIISTPKNPNERRMTFQTSVVHRGKTISSLKTALVALLNAIEKVPELKISTMEFNYFRLFTTPLNKSEINRIIALEQRLCDYPAQNYREPLLGKVA
tara:strand:+ start:861 stop:1289 length:429 start_codon:yes stop_codon:yes gene_type:complete